MYNKENMIKYRKEKLLKIGITGGFWENFVSPQVKRIKGNKCEKCGGKEHLDIHHTNYDVVNINTLMLLCRSCHKYIH